MNCALCKKKIEETFLGKLRGTIVKLKKGNENKIVYSCPECQGKFKNKLKEEIAKII